MSDIEASITPTSATGSETVTVAAEATAVSGGKAAAVYRPSSLDELRELVLQRDGDTLVVRGAATQLQTGSAPAGDFALVETARALSGEIEHQPADLTAVVPAGTPLAELQDVLAAHQQWLPLDPPRADLATIGGTLAAGVGGPLRGRYGAPRDLVLGMTVLRPDGVFVKAGGRVVKNVTGYDMMRVWCGSFGTLGVITEVALRVYPVVPTADAVLHRPDFASAVALIDQLVRADLRMQIADAFPLTGGGGTDGGWQILVRAPEISWPALLRLAGSEAASTDSGALHLRGRDLGFGPDSALTLRLAAMPSQVERSVAALLVLKPTDLVARPATGFVRATWDKREVPPIDALRGVIGRLRGELGPIGGSLVIERMPEPLRAVLDPWGPPPQSFELMKRLKATYDPEGRMAKGRFVGGI